MKTQIFASYHDFLNRRDKSINGVSREFASEYPDWEEMNSSNMGCWNCRACMYCRYCRYCGGCQYCSDCSYSRSCSYCVGCSDCSSCNDCRNCSSSRFCISCNDCRYCNECTNCSDCSSCTDCSDCNYCCYCNDCEYCDYCYGKKRGVEGTEFPEIPVLENIHQRVYASASRPLALDMGAKHSCETTHCRAGWVVHLAGAKGYALEKATSTLFAAQQIYKASSPIPVSPARFFEENNAVALEDMKECAEEEAAFSMAGTQALA